VPRLSARLSTSGRILDLERDRSGKSGAEHDVLDSFMVVGTVGRGQVLRGWSFHAAAEIVVLLPGPAIGL